MLRLTALAALAYASVGIVMAEQPIPVKADVFAQHSDGKIVYYYRVFNNSQRDISAVSIGHDTKNDENPSNDIYELYELPSGWNIKFGIPSTSSNSPTGWRVSVTDPEEDNTHAITWEPLNENSPKLIAGQMLGKMSIAVDKADTNYLTGHVRVTFTKGNPESLSVPLKHLDDMPPSLEVILKPAILQSTNNKPVAVHATFAVKDDYDRMPEIKLESITSNEPLEPDDIRDASIGADDRYILLRAQHKFFSDRVYTLTYSATDASGNQTTASATVTVPHAQAD